MAVDTRDKRASVLGLALAALVVLPQPAGAIDQADRQQVALCYRGILAGSPVAVDLDPVETTATSLMARYTASSTLAVLTAVSLASTYRASSTTASTEAVRITETATVERING